MSGQSVDAVFDSVKSFLSFESTITDQTTGQNLQLAIRRLISINEADKPNVQVQQLVLLHRVLRQFGPSHVRGLRLLVAELVFKTMVSPSAECRLLSARLHRWFLLLFGSDMVQQRCEFLAIAIFRLTCVHLGVERLISDFVNTENQPEHFANVHRICQSNVEARLAEHLQVLSPVDLLASYCHCLASLFDQVTEKGNASSVEFLTPSLLALFDLFNEVLANARTNTTVATARLFGAATPLLHVIQAILESKFRKQLTPMNRRISTPIHLIARVLEHHLLNDAQFFSDWAKTLNLIVDAYGFRLSGHEENLIKHSLEVLNMGIRKEFSTPTQLFCHVEANANQLFASILSNSVPSQRSPSIDLIISSAIQFLCITMKNDNALAHHSCSKCAYSIANLLTSAVLSPPFAANGTPCLEPTIADLFYSLSVQTRNEKCEVATIFRNALSTAMTATARPLVPPMGSQSISKPNGAPMPISTPVVPAVEKKMETESSTNKPSESPAVPQPNDIIPLFTPVKQQQDPSSPTIDLEKDEEDVIVLDDESPSKFDKTSDDVIKIDDDSAVVDGLFTSFVACPPDQN